MSSAPAAHLNPERTDVLIVGAGLLGCFAARALAAYDLRVTVVEQREDVCTGISKANTGIIYAGYDNMPGSLKSRLCVRACADFPALCRELDVPFSPCGSLMAAFGPRGERVLRKKLEQGLKNGVPGLRLLDRDAVLDMEPNLSPAVTAALYAPGTCTVDPWALGIAAFENAAANGADFRFLTRLEHLERTGGGFAVETSRGSFFARAVLNCAGLSAAEVRETWLAPRVRLFPSAADYFVLDDALKGFIRHVIFHEPEQKGKGLTLVPTVDGNLLAGPTEREPDGPAGSVSVGGLEELTALCREVVPALPTEQMIRSFGALRPNPDRVELRNGVWQRAGAKIPDFCILEEDGLFSLIGVKTPGLTCARELGVYMAERLAAYLGGAGPNPDFDPHRRAAPRTRGMDFDRLSALIASDSAYGSIVCRCKSVTEGEVCEAIRRGAVTLDGVKRRTGAGMGRCQGGFCTQRILELLAAETGTAPTALTKDGGSSFFYTGASDGNC